MPLSRIWSVACIALDTLSIELEVDINLGIDKNLGIVIVGLPDATVKESRDRVLTGIKNSGYPMPEKGVCTVNMAPGNLRKAGALYDLPIALGILSSLEHLKSQVFDDYIIVGEMALSGSLRPLRGALSMAMFAKQSGKKGILLPAESAPEASMVSGIDVIPINSLKEAAHFLHNPSSITPLKNTLEESIFSENAVIIDFADIKGQHHVKRAMEIAAAGGHNILLSGPPGSGKTMISKALCGIMPELSAEEALECTKIHSIMGLMGEGQSLITRRPFRSPHHTVSYAGLIGGGSVPRPGEVSLAHNGILFLDELPEFSRTTLEVLRQPLQDHYVTISRANGHFTFPTNFICVCAMNPCPCGYLGHPDKPCTDHSHAVERYRSKISGPLLDRLDMHVEVPALRYSDMHSNEKSESSAIVRERVKAARKRQNTRFGSTRTNSQMSSAELKSHFPLDADCRALMQQAVDHQGISVRAHDNIHRVAASIADLEAVSEIRAEYLMEALYFRNLPTAKVPEGAALA